MKAHTETADTQMTAQITGGLFASGMCVCVCGIRGLCVASLRGLQCVGV